MEAGRELRGATLEPAVVGVMGSRYTYTSEVGTYLVEETDERVASIDVALRTRFKWRAERKAKWRNEGRRVPFYRWEVQREGKRWVVVAMQNRAMGVQP